MSLVEHLEELRRSMINVALILVVAFFACYGIGDIIAEYLLAPLRFAITQGGGERAGEIVYLGLLDKVLSQLQVAFWSSVIISSPLWFWQIWKFVRPGLYEHEVKAVRPFILVGFLLFWSGVAFAYYLVFPFAFQTLMQFGVQGVHATIALKEYLILASKILVFMGIVFQVPNALLILGFMGLVTKYSLRKHRRYIYVALAIASAIATPPDVFTMMALWLPLVFLYELGILAVAVVVHPYLARQHR
jgi:sec-independent protein translocase protein TatC